MLSENIKAFRRSKGLSQEELALKLNVVRQTVSKWEQGLSVPDSDLLIKLSEALEVPVSTLLGETVNESRADDIKKLSEKLEVINLQLARRKESRRKALHIVFIAIAAATLYHTCLAEQPIPQMGQKRPGDCRFQCGVSCIRISVCPHLPVYACRGDRRRSTHTQKGVKRQAQSAIRPKCPIKT